MRVSNSFRKARGNRQQGYILLTLILFAVLLAIGAAAMLPEFTFQMKRDREEEMIHRGVQYSRAVRRYYKKLGRYPNTVEELQSTNNTHFLRKKYKDPVTGKDFRLLHLTDVQQLLAGAGMMGMGGGPGMAAMGAVGAGGLNTMRQAGGTGTRCRNGAAGGDGPGLDGASHHGNGTIATDSTEPGRNVAEW